MSSLSHFERHALGVRARKQVPRSAHGAFEPKACPQDPLALLFAAERGRIAKLLVIKHQRMAASPFGFFRGAVPVMAADLACHPNTGIMTQMCGDAHVLNLGAYEGSDGHMVFDINDFDETLRGPFEFDVKRMATSLVLAGDAAKIKPGGCQDAVEVFLRAYCGLMKQFARMPVLELARYQVHRLASVAPVSKILRKAQRATPMLSLDKLTEKTAKGRVFKSNPPLLRPVTGKEAQSVLDSLTLYTQSLLPERRHFFAQFEPLAVAFKVVGTGSVGLRDYTILMQGNGASDPMFLQVKEEAKSAWAPYIPQAMPPAKNDGQRTVEGQRAMQLQSDPLLGWTSFDGRDYLVRQLNDHKAGVDITTLNAAGLAAYAEVCGEMLARGHARSGEAGLIAGYIGNGARFKRGLLGFARAYAAQTVEDWKLLVSNLPKA
jgi:uncharacterized protein (DUF2252 family)